MISKESLWIYAKDFGIDLSENQLDKFDLYAKSLVEWNERINLTTITDPEGIIIKHFIDSLSLLSVIDIKHNSSLIDVGTGAGFPSMPLAIVRPDVKITQLDSLLKRVNFLGEVADLLNINVEILHMRAEEGSRNSNLREKFDYVVARAVARLNILSEYCIPYIKVGGHGIFLKGYDIGEEFRQASRAINLLGCDAGNIEKIVLPKNNKRSIIIVKKISQTSLKYPRINKKINESPL